MNQDCGMIRKEEYWNMLRCFSKLKGYEGWLLAQMNWHVTALSGKEAKQQPNIVRAEKKYQTDEQEMETTEKPAQINWQIQEKKKKTFATITLSGTDDGYQHEITVLLVKPKEDFSIHGTRQQKACEPDLSDKRKQPEYAEAEHRKSLSPQDLVTDHKAEYRKSLSQQDTATVYKVDEKKQTISFTNSQIKDYLEQTKDYNPIHEGENAIVPGFLILQKLLFELHVTDLLKENKIARVLMDHSCPDKEKEPEEGNREQCNEEQQISGEKKDFAIEMTWKGIFYCNEECTIYRSDVYTLCGKAGQRILWICKVK